MLTTSTFQSSSLLPHEYVSRSMDYQPSLLSKPKMLMSLAYYYILILTAWSCGSVVKVCHWNYLQLSQSVSSSADVGVCSGITPCVAGSVRHVPTSSVLLADFRLDGMKQCRTAF